MRYAILGIIVLCLTLAASSAPAEEMVLKLEIATEQETDEQELQRRLLADIGVTEAELMQFGVNLAGAMEPYEQIDQTDAIFALMENTTHENYVDVAGEYYDNFIQPLFGAMRTEAVNFFSEDQYANMMTLAYQVAENYPDAFRLNEVPVSDMVQLFLLPDVVPLTEEQWIEIAAMQKEMMAEMVGIDVLTRKDNPEWFDEQNALFEKLEKAENDEDKKVIKANISKVQKQISASMQERIQKAFDKQKAKLDTLLTAEQKEKLTQIKQDIPDYLKDALAKMTQTKTDDDPDDNAETSAAWRPGINSWVPGQGAPKDLENYPREAPRVREPRGERRFPGSE